MSVEQNELLINLAFTPAEIEKMLANAKVGGLVQIKVRLNMDIVGDVKEVILR